MSSVVLAFAAAALFVVGVVTLSNSQEGEAVGVDDRPTVRFPATPNGVLAIAASTGELASVAVTTLLPEGQGGSVVAVPVTADTSSGLGLQRRPLNDVFDVAAAGPTRDALEAMLALTIERIEVVDAESLDAFLPSFETLDVDLAFDADDTTGGGPVRIAEAGTAVLTRDEVIAVLTSVDANADSVERYANDVAIWTSIAALAGSTTAGGVEVDDEGRPLPPASMADLTDRLWVGPVGARGLSTRAVLDGNNPDGVDVTVLDRPDTTLTFAQVSPSLVSTPNVGLSMRIEARFTDEQLAAGGADRSALAREMVARMTFLQANVVSVDSGAGEAPAVTIVEVANAALVEEAVEAGPLLYGEVEVRVAEVVLEGVDVVVILGESYLEFDAERQDEGDEVDVPVFEGNVVDSTEPPATVVDDE